MHERIFSQAEDHVAQNENDAQGADEWIMFSVAHETEQGESEKQYQHANPDQAFVDQCLEVGAVQSADIGIGFGVVKIRVTDSALDVFVFHPCGIAAAMAEPGGITKDNQGYPPLLKPESH